MNLSPESEAFLANPDDPRNGTANKVVFTKYDDNASYSLRISFPEGEDIVEHGLDADAVWRLAVVLDLAGYRVADSEGQHLVFTAPETDEAAA